MIKKAWIVRDDFEGRATIVFHHHGMAARRIGASKLCIDFDGADIERKKCYDKYCESGIVPQSILIGDGWYFECVYCGLEVSEDNFSDKGLDLNGIIPCGDDSLYCSKKCRDEHENEKSLHNKKFNDFEKKMKSLRPDLKFVRFIGLHPIMTMQAFFMFDGAKHGGHYSVNVNEESDLQLFVANGDIDAWNRYEDLRSSGNI